MKPIIILIALFSSLARAEFWASIELGPVWQSRNDVRIPVNSGTRFSLTEPNSGPFFSARFYGGYQIADRHSLRLLIAPFSVTVSGTYANQIDFDGSTFVGGTALSATYQFNSYRLTYAYRFYESDVWHLGIGFTAKIRDAKISLQQGATYRENKNVGFVPLLHFSAKYLIDEEWSLLADLDGLAAPQGRAVDLALQARFKMTPSWEIYGGYRTLEGGADNKTVFTFAWLHYLLLGTEVRF